MKRREFIKLLGGVQSCSIWATPANNWAPNASMSRNCPSLVTIASHMGCGFALQSRQLWGC